MGTTVKFHSETSTSSTLRPAEAWIPDRMYSRVFFAVAANTNSKSLSVWLSFTPEEWEELKTAVDASMKKG